MKTFATEQLEMTREEEMLYLMETAAWHIRKQGRARLVQCTEEWAAAYGVQKPQED